MKLVDRIYLIMESKNMKQSAVARAAGYSPKMFNAILRERKILRAEDITKICLALDVTPNELFGFQTALNPGKSDITRREM